MGGEVIGGVSWKCGRPRNSYACPHVCRWPRPLPCARKSRPRRAQGVAGWLPLDTSALGKIRTSKIGIEERFAC